MMNDWTASSSASAAASYAPPAMSGSRRVRGTLEDELERAFAHIASGSQATRNHDIVSRYFGLDGQGGTTMEVAGKAYDLTRESVRIKIEAISSLLRHYYTRGGQFTILGKIMALMESAAPARADIVEEMLVERGLVRDRFRLEGILSLCEIVRLRLDLAPVLEFNGQRWLLMRNQMGMHKKGLYSLVHQAASTMNKSMSHDGAVYLPDHAARLQLKSPEKARQLIDQIAATRPDLCIAASDPDWVWFAQSPRSCLRNRLLKIFSVVETGELADIHAGIERNYRKTRAPSDICLPIPVLADILRAMPELEVQGRTVRCLKRPEPEEHLIGVEADLVRFMARHPSELVKRVAVTALAATKQEQYALSMSLNFSCVLLGNARKGYRLVGTPWPEETPE